MKRADKLLLESYPEFSRNKIQNLIDRGKVYYRNHGQWQLLRKSSQKMAEEEGFEWKIEEDEEGRFVSRAGFKLEKAIEHFSMEVAQKVCLDVGLSTGGFSHCLLERGAQRILGIDVGHSQLHKSLESESRLVALDKTNARKPLPASFLKEHFGEESFKFDLIVIDVSFISLDKIIGTVLQYLRSGGEVLALIKPQFEVGRGNLNKKGVVKSSDMVVEVVEKNIELFSNNGLEIVGQFQSPIEGENGNQEVFLLAEKV